MSRFAPLFAVCFGCLFVAHLLAVEIPAFVELGSPQEEAYFVTFSPDGKKIVTTNRQFIAKIWDADTGEELQKIDAVVIRDTIQPPTSTYIPKLTSAAFSPDGKKLVTASCEKFARIWDMGTGKELHKLEGHDGEVRSVAFSLDGKKVATAAWDDTARIWDAESGKELQKLEFPRMDEIPGWSKGIFAVFSPDGKKIITYAFNDSIVRIWDTETGKTLLELKGHSPSPCSAAFSPDGKEVVTTTWESLVRIWDAETGKVLHTVGGGVISGVREFPIFPDRKRIILRTGDTAAKICDIESGKELYRLKRVDSDEYSKYVESLDLSPDGKKIVARSYDAQNSQQIVRIWDADTGKVLQTLTGHTYGIVFARFSPDGKKIAVPTGDTHHGYITHTRIWKLE